jgi:hypothetical protein
VFTKDGIRTLANIVIVNSTQANLFLDLAQLKDLILSMWLKPNKELL